MPPKKKKRSGDIRSLVIEHFLNGDFYAMIAKKVLVPHPTVQSIIKKYKQTMHFERLGPGPKTKDYTASLHRIIQRKIKKICTDSEC